MLTLPLLSLYVHIPWCVQKCPYCDFNSHAQKDDIPETEYIEHLLTDLRHDLAQYSESIAARPLHSIFIGGGTPSLFSPDSIGQLLEAIKQQIPFSADVEITLEANPGTVEAARFEGYAAVGVTRISMGIQSFNDDKLQGLGRIHNAAEAEHAVGLLKSSGVTTFNLDLMHGLPNQTLDEALHDLHRAIALSPPHLSWYQLTIEPNTQFASRPPKLPDEDALWDIFEQGDQLLRAAGYQQYETSAYAKPGYQCRHNLNYWRFGDYLAIGCGAHGKLSFTDGRILRYSKTRHPRGYMRGEYTYETRWVTEDERIFEFFMNRFRLLEAVPKADFMAYTGLPLSVVAGPMARALAENYVSESAQHWQITEHGKLFLNSLLEIFLD